jgi:Arc/MetJ-type ribon-helix-helix transcriptional regulator
MAWPSTDDPRTEFVTVRFTVNESVDIDWLTVATGAKSRSEAVRTAVDRVVSAERKRAARLKKAATPGPGMLDPEHSDRHESEETA